LLVRLLGEVEVTAHHHIVASSAQLKQITVNSTVVLHSITRRHSISDKSNI
jgi:hypothetical protein